MSAKPSRASRSSSAAAIVDLPEAGRPVSHTVAPRWPSSAQRALRASRLESQLMSACFASGRSRCVSMIMPAPTVPLVASSITMKLPVVRLRRYSSKMSGTLVRSRTRPMSLSPSWPAFSSRCSELTSIR